MSKNIFVNIENQDYATITYNTRGKFYGLGEPTQLTTEESLELGIKRNELFFTREELLDKKRKIEIVYDSFTSPAFFSDGAVKIDEVKKYIGEIEAGRAVGTGTLGEALVGSILKGNIQAGREDNAAPWPMVHAPWQMTRADFPSITSQAIKGSSNRRSIERLYDDRGGVKTFDVSTQEAIALLVRETLADALFCTSVPNGDPVKSLEHPGPRGNGTAEKWKDKDKLKIHFPFKHEKSLPFKHEKSLTRTYVKALIYLKSYIELIERIVNLSDSTLSRSPDTTSTEIDFQIEITLATAQVALSSALTQAAESVIDEKIFTFFDDAREYKTVLNLGNDDQYLVESWRFSPESTGSVQLKLFEPLLPGLETEDTAFISRELAQPVVDIIDFTLSPARDATPYLRPHSISTTKYVNTNISIQNISLDTLGISGSGGVITDQDTVSYGDIVFRRWFNTDYNSSELNIDFTNYENFVHFGSAYSRVVAFANKLIKIEQLNQYNVSASVSASNIAVRLQLKEAENIIRSFDPYERFLYFATGSFPYSASVDYTSTEIEYNEIAYWPKQADGVPYSPSSIEGSAWLTFQGQIARRYDDANQNYLIHNIPAYLVDNEESVDFLTFISMIGHIWDNIKVYIDQFPNIYSTKLNPFEDLTMDQVYEVARSFGLELPNPNSLDDLQSYYSQYSNESDSRTYVAETWKRFLHSMVYLLKSKGTRGSLDAILNTYGVGTPVLQPKETSYPSGDDYITSEEFTYALRFTGSLSNFIQVPIISSSVATLTTQLSFLPIARTSSSLFTGNGWAIDLVPHPSSSKETYGRIEIVSGSGRVSIVTSSYFPLFDDDYTRVMLRSQSADMTIIQTDGDQILFQETIPTTISEMWDATELGYVGGSGSIKLGNFDGIVDDVRIWGETITDDKFVAQAYDPGSYYGNTYTSSYDNLYVDLSFSQPVASISASATNETPYQNAQLIGTLVTNGFTDSSYVRILRNIKQFVPQVGSTVYTNKKVTVAPPPVFGVEFVDGDGTKILSRKRSIVKPGKKEYTAGQNVVSFAISPTDYVNQNIIRSMGVVSVNQLIGSPRYIKGIDYTSLKSIYEDYLKYFSETVKPNEYIRFFKNLIKGPGEAAKSMIPGRAKLIEGIVIESPVIYRTRVSTAQKFAASGTGTKKFIRYAQSSSALFNSKSGSLAYDVGAYDFSQEISGVEVLPSPFGSTLPIEADIDIPNYVVPRSSTKPSKMPPFRRVIQRTSAATTGTASIMDNNSAYDTLEADAIDLIIYQDTISSPYARNPYLGIPAEGTTPTRLASNDNTLIPLYDISPRADINDVGTTTYFHKSTGVYSYDIYTKYKQEYLVKLDTISDVPSEREYAPITLLPPDTVIGEYGRELASIATNTYGAGARVFGSIKVAKVFTIIGIEGTSLSGLRIRLYNDTSKQLADAEREFNTAPTADSGVLFDGILSNVNDVFPYVLLQSSDAAIYYTVDNPTASTIQTDIELTYFAYQPDNLVPVGYLPRHYRFSRDNGTALKRRNYLGCKTRRGRGGELRGVNPIEIKISPQNTVTVNATTATLKEGNTVQIPTEVDSIKFGGSGRLDVE